MARWTAGRVYHRGLTVGALPAAVQPLDVLWALALEVRRAQRARRRRLAPRRVLQRQLDRVGFLAAPEVEPRVGVEDSAACLALARGPAPRKRAGIYFGWVFFLISLGQPHVRCTPMGVHRTGGASYVRGARRNRIGRHGGEIGRLVTRTTRSWGT